MSTVPPGSGLLGGIKASASTLLAMLKTRLDLLGNELQFEKKRILRLVGLGLALVFFAGVAVLLMVAFMALLFWEQRLLVVGLFMATFFGVAVWCVRGLQATLKEGETPFSATMAELQNDLAALRQATQKPGDKP